MLDRFDLPTLVLVQLQVQRGVVAYQAELYRGQRNLFGETVNIVPCNIGNANAAVFPLPVSAKPIRSRPCKASGIDSAWIGVGAL